MPASREGYEIDGSGICESVLARYLAPAAARSARGGVKFQLRLLPLLVLSDASGRLLWLLQSFRQLPVPLIRTLLGNGEGIVMFQGTYNQGELVFCESHAFQLTASSTAASRFAPAPESASVPAKGRPACGIVPTLRDRATAPCHRSASPRNGGVVPILAESWGGPAFPSCEPQDIIVASSSPYDGGCKSLNRAAME